MRYIKVLIIILSFLLIPFIANAQTSHMMHFQGVLVDEGGNVLYDVQEADIVFSIVDGAGAVLFSERQHLVLVGGATAALIGRGERISGDDLIDVFDMPGDKLLRVQVEGYPIPQEDAQIVHVPYAMVAERLSSDITSAQIANGTIEQEDLSETLLNYIDNLTGLTEDDLIAHRTESGAHPATSIIVENTFVNTPGTNLQQILQGIDTAIGIRRNQDGVLQGNIDAHTSPANTSAHSFTNISGQLATNQIEDNAVISSKLQSSATDNAQRAVTKDHIRNDAINSAKIENNTITTDDLAFNFNGWDTNASNDITTSGGTISGGELRMQQNIVMDDGCAPEAECLTVDNVDISALKAQVDAILVSEAREPEIRAWGVVTIDRPNDPSPDIDGFNVSSIQAGNVNGADIFVPGANDGDYKIYFTDRISGNYVLTGALVYNGIEPPRGSLNVMEKNQDYVIVRATDSGGGSTPDISFNFTIVGNP